MGHTLPIGKQNFGAKESISKPIFLEVISLRKMVEDEWFGARWEIYQIYNHAYTVKDSLF